MLQRGFRLGLDKTFDRLGVFKTYSDALWLSDLAWSYRWFADDLKLVSVIGMEGGNKFLPSGTYFEHILIVDLEKDG